MRRNILITGGAGFIGSHVANHFRRKYPEYGIFVFDLLTYASNPKYLDGNIAIYSNQDINNDMHLTRVFEDARITDVIHLAAESHVDNSITNPHLFAKTNVIGTLNLLHTAKRFWKDKQDHRFFHISTDEVYGSLELSDDGFTEKTPYDPRSPYSASKAASDHFVRAYHHTYKLPILISNCSNNYGPHQHGEKLIPKVIKNIINNEPIPIYGDGSNIRDWLWVGDHANAIDKIFHNGVVGETYNIGGRTELTNKELIEMICTIMASEGIKPLEESKKLMTYVEDRKGHDLRYAIDSSKLELNLGWKPEKPIVEGLKETIKYYIEND